MFSYVKLYLLCGGSIDGFCSTKISPFMIIYNFYMCVWESDIVNIWLIMQISYL